MRIVKLLFWEGRTGRVGRLAFVGCSAAIWALLYGVGLLMPGPITDEELLSPNELHIIAIAVLGVLSLIVTLNLAAKRFRDMGAPGWWALLGVTLLNTVLIFTVPGLAYPWFGFIVLALLALAPTDVVSRRN